jgi:cell division protein FtsA
LGLLERLAAGVFLCGGGARIPRIQTLAQNVLQLPVFLGNANSISGLKSALDQPEFATAIGLVKFGSLQHKRKGNGGVSANLRKTFAELFKK